MCVARTMWTMKADRPGSAQLLREHEDTLQRVELRQRTRSRRSCEGIAMMRPWTGRQRIAAGPYAWIFPLALLSSLRGRFFAWLSRSTNDFSTSAAEVSDAVDTLFSTPKSEGEHREEKYTRLAQNRAPHRSHRSQKTGRFHVEAVRADAARGPKSASLLCDPRTVSHAVPIVESNPTEPRSRQVSRDGCFPIEPTRRCFLRWARSLCAVAVR